MWSNLTNISSAALSPVFVGFVFRHSHTCRFIGPQTP